MTTDVAVIGGGLGGLMAATLAARHGQRVTLWERASVLGGRGRTTVQDGFHMNLGPHALYVAGDANRLLTELGVRPVGAKPRLPGLSTWSPAGATPQGYWQVARMLAAAPFWSTAQFRGQTVDTWLAARLTEPGALRLAWALLRTVSYCADGDADAGRMALQLQRAVHNVLYLDGGWQQLVDGLENAAQVAGVQLYPSAAVERVEPGVVWVGGQSIEAKSIILAVSPTAAAALLPESVALGQLASEARPVYAACLDVALSEVPHPARTFAAGFVDPTYLSVHSASADLAPPGGGLLHALWYRRHGDGGDHRDALERMLDVEQPGWRDVVVHARYLPKMVVANDRMRADAFPNQVPDVPGVWVVGDWVGAEGWLLDAVAQSARKAAKAVGR
ncbi:MAG: FAD-dependent oxidoreductase [Myxococcota bacterium]